MSRLIRWALVGVCCACCAFGGTTGRANGPWPYSVASAPELPFDPLPLPDPGRPLPAPGQSVQAPPSNSVLVPNEGPVAAAPCGPLDDGCPGYRLYAVADALFMGRYSGLTSRPLVFSESSGATLLGTESLQWGFMPGVRAFFGERKPGGCGWEVGYLGLFGMYNSAQAFGPGNLVAPGDLGANANQFNSADLMQVNYLSNLNIAQANVFWYDCCGSNPCQTGCQTGCQDPCKPSCGSCHCIDLMAGMWWAGLNESANFNSTCCGLRETSVYGVNTTNNLFGGQVGVRGRKDYERWACEGWLKFGLAGAWMSQNQAPIIDFQTGIPYRGASSSTATGLAGLVDSNASAIYKINRMWGLRAGVNAIWLGNVAMAPDQWDFSQTSSVTTINPGSLFLLGANLGVEGRW